jgi:hypothetical protein
MSQKYRIEFIEPDTIMVDIYINFLADVPRVNRAEAKLRSYLYREGDPMVCLSCGAKTDSIGGLPCGH